MSGLSGQRAAPLLAACALSLGSPGCRCSDNKPYTPFGVASSLGDAEAPPASASSATPPVDAGSLVEKSVLAPPNSRRWSLGGSELAAPEGFVFEQGLSADFDGDGTPDAVAWVVPDGDAGQPPSPGEAWFFPGKAAARRLAALPGFVPTNPTCALHATLARTGPHTATIDVRADCQGKVIQRSPVRALIVLAPASERAEVLVLRVAAPAPDETIELSTVTVDRDGDGRDDVEVQVAVGSPGVEAPSAPFAWLDRAVGPSRDTAETKKTLERIAAREAGRAKQKKVAEDVVKRVGAIRRLLATLCSEGATPRIFDGEGNGLACGSLTAVVDSLATAEIGAELTRGRVFEAFGALARDGWYFGKTSSAARKRLEKSLLDAVKPATASVSVVDFRPFVRTKVPAYSPFWFEADGRLFARSDEGRFFQIDPGAASATYVKFDDLPDPIPRLLDVYCSDALAGVVYSCDRSDVSLLVAGGISGGVPWIQGGSVPTGLLAPRPGACGRTRFEPKPGLVPIGCNGSKFVVLLGGAVIGDLASATTPVRMGSARSADKRWVVTPTPFGLLLAGPETVLMNLGPGAGDPLRLVGCVPANDGKTVACVADDKVFVARSD